MKNVIFSLALIVASTETLHPDGGIGVFARAFLEETALAHYEDFQSECFKNAQRLANSGNALSDKLSKIKSIVCNSKQKFINSSYCNFIEDFRKSSKAETYKLSQILEKTVREETLTKAYNTYMEDFEDKIEGRLSSILKKLKSQNEITKICVLVRVAKMAEDLKQKLGERFQSLFEERFQEFSTRMKSHRKTISDWKHHIITSYNKCLQRPDYSDCLDNYAEEPPIRKIPNQFNLTMRNVVELTKEQIETVGPKLSGVFELINFDGIDSLYDECNVKNE